MSFFEGLLAMENFKLTRKPGEVARRLLAVAACAAVALHPDLRDDIVKWFRVEDLMSCLSDNELSFILDSAPKHHQVVQYSWYIEAAVVLGWALCLIDNLPLPVGQSSISDIVELIPAPGESTFGFVNGSVLRSDEQLCEAAKNLERIHSLARSDQDNGRPIRGGGDIDVIQEHHRAIKWLVADEGLDWELVATNT